jgi:hypothetical protein
MMRERNAIEFRRGLNPSGWQKVWHFVPTCLSFPRAGFLIAERKLSPDEICTACNKIAAARGHA